LPSYPVHWSGVFTPQGIGGGGDGDGGEGGGGGLGGDGGGGGGEGGDGGGLGGSLTIEPSPKQNFHPGLLPLPSERHVISLAATTPSGPVPLEPLYI